MDWIKLELSTENNGNGDRKITERESFAPECDLTGGTTLDHVEIVQNAWFFFSFRKTTHS